MAQIFAHKSLETLKAEASDESPHREVKLNRALSMLSLRHSQVQKSVLASRRT
jgi:hypothetical protein